MAKIITSMKLTNITIMIIFIIAILMMNTSKADEIIKCESDIAQYFIGLNDYISCAMKSIMFYNYADFKDDYGYLYFLTFKTHLHRGSILKPSEYCAIYFAEYNQRFDNQMNQYNRMQFGNDVDKTMLISNLVYLANKRSEKYENSSQYEFEERQEIEDLSELTIYTYKVEENNEVFSCKNELGNYGFSDKITKDAVEHTFFWRKYTDFEDCKFVKGYMRHIAISIKIDQMEDPITFCSKIVQSGKQLMNLLLRQTHVLPIEPTQLYHTEIENQCHGELNSIFGGLRNYKEIGDYVLVNIDVERLLDNSYPKTYINILVNQISPGSTKSILRFCQLYSNRSKDSKIAFLLFNENDNEEETNKCIYALSEIHFVSVDTNNKNEIISHAFKNISFDNNAQNNYDNDVYLKAYIDHIKVNYHMRSTMESPDTFCYFSSTLVTSWNPDDE